MVGQPGCFRYRFEELSGLSLHSLRSYPVLYLILGLVLGGSSAKALDSSSSFSGYAATTWTHRDGLLSTFIRSVVQTTDGYIWLGTTDGLFRFDGVRFVQWRTRGDVRRGLGIVNTLCSARNGTLLVGTEAGIVGRVQGENLVSIRTGAAVQGILEDRDGTI